MLLLLQINALLQALSLLVRQSLPFERKLGQLLHPLRHVIVREQARPSDEAVRSGLGAGAEGRRRRVRPPRHAGGRRPRRLPRRASAGVSDSKVFSLVTCRR